MINNCIDGAIIQIAPSIQLRLEAEQMKAKTELKILLSAIAAGVSISIGATSYILIENKYLGALAFVVGLLIIRTFKFSLFTGKVYKAKANIRYIIYLSIIWLVNFIGVALTSAIEMGTRLSTSLYNGSLHIVSVKTNDSLLSLFLLGILCNIMIYLAVEGDRIALIYGVSIFVLCGFEHCVADMYYFSIAGTLLNVDNMIRILVVTAGNTAGGLLINFAASRNLE